MKIKVDHVTNSSSEVFGVVLADSAVTAGLLFMLDTLTTGYRSTNMSQKQDELYDELMMESERMASRITEGVIDDARQQEKIVTDAYDEALSLLLKASKDLQSELSQTKKNWETTDKTADKTTSEYQVQSDKNKAYLDYLSEQLKQIELQKSSIEKDRSSKQSLISERDAWIQQNQSDYVMVQEQKSLLMSMGPMFDTGNSEGNPWLNCFKELEKREIDIDKTLMAANARCEYIALAKGELQPNPETQALLIQLETEKFNYDLLVADADASTHKKLRHTYEKKCKALYDQVLNANRGDLATKASEGLQYGADVAVDGLAELAGPAGAQIKIAYGAIKTMFLGIKDAKNDPKNKSKHLAKAILNTSAIAIKDRYGDQPWAKEATTLLNTTLQSSLSASIAGTSIPESIGTSLTKGIFDLGVEKGIVALKEATTISQETIEPQFDLLTPQELLNDNPLTQKLSESFKTEIIFTP
ncbi:MAG: hypothetical protein FD133_425 [Erysipelotrichaceae bacterium]|nr:MAG: hypothetical protein FD179_1042 [Erysipelotrichaceae bacterium]TXT19253.1 MAG: hypothetical protein FD133_425 [Erysipelotrichaceae bacterium]